MFAVLMRKGIIPQTDGRALEKVRLAQTRQVHYAVALTAFSARKVVFGSAVDARLGTREEIVIDMLIA